MRSLLYALAVISLLPALPSSAQASSQNQDPNPSPVLLDRVTGSRPLPNGVDLTCGRALMRVTALSNEVLRVRIAAAAPLPEDASWAALPEARRAQARVTPDNGPGYVGFRTAALEVRIRRQPLLLTVRDLGGNIIAEDYPGRPVEYHGTEFRVFRRSPAEEHYFGLGDKAGPLDRRNHAFTDWNTDAAGWQPSTDPIYKSIPFVLTFRRAVAAGLFLDNTWRSSFDFNKQYPDAYSFGAVDGPLDYYILYGPEPKQVLERWAWLSGHTPLPPLWSLGYQQSRYSYEPQAEVERIARRLRAEKIPADAIYLDIDYQDRLRPFTVDPVKFPDLGGLIADLSAMHLRTVLITDLHIAHVPAGGYRPYDEGAAGDRFVHNRDGSVYVGDVWPGPAVFPEFTEKATREWWGTLYADFARMGAAGFWNDMNEPAVFNTPGKTMPGDVRHRIDEPGFASRTATHLEIHNVFGMENSRATYDGLRRLQPGVRPFVLTRASYAGGQRYAATWTGDNSSTWSHLSQTIPQLENLGLSGFAMSGADVGGFEGSPQPALLTRWIQVAAFQPLDRNHTSKGTYPQEPWENGSAHDLELRRSAIEERYRLMPYLYTAAEEMARTGVPILRPVFLEFPRAAADLRPLDLDAPGEFLFGRSLLVAPGPHPDERDDYAVTLPAIDWYDYWTGRRLRAASLRESDGQAGLERTAADVLRYRVHPDPDLLPVFVREGSIVPVAPLTASTGEKPQGPLTLRVYPGRDCRGEVYLDDGISDAFERGEALREAFSCQETAAGVSVRVAAREGRFEPWWKQLRIEIYGLDRPAASVSAAGAAYEAAYHRETVLMADDGQGTQLTLTY